MRDEAENRVNHRRTMTNTRYGGARVAVRRRRARHRLLRHAWPNCSSLTATPRLRLARTILATATNLRGLDVPSLGAGPRFPGAIDAPTRPTGDRRRHLGVTFLIQAAARPPDASNPQEAAATPGLRLANSRRRARADYPANLIHRPWPRTSLPTPARPARGAPGFPDRPAPRVPVSLFL